MARAQVDGKAALGGKQAVQRRHMAQRQVDHVDIVAHARAIGRSVVVAEDGQALAATHCHLGDEGHQVVRNAGRILTDQAAGMRTHRVEIAQHTDLPLGVGMHDIGQDLLDHQLGAAVGIGHGQARRFQDRQGFRVAVHGGRRAEHKTLHVRRRQHFQQRHGARHIVIHIHQRLRHGFAHRLQAREMDHRIDGVLAQDGGHGRTIAHVSLVEGHAFTGNSLHARHGFTRAIAQIIHRNDFKAGSEQFDARMRADETGCAGDEYFLGHNINQCKKDNSSVIPQTLPSQRTLARMKKPAASPRQAGSLASGTGGQTARFSS